MSDALRKIDYIAMCYKRDELNAEDAMGAIAAALTLPHFLDDAGEKWDGVERRIPKHEKSVQQAIDDLRVYERRKPTPSPDAGEWRGYREKLARQRTEIRRLNRAIFKYSQALRLMAGHLNEARAPWDGTERRKPLVIMDPPEGRGHFESFENATSEPFPDKSGERVDRWICGICGQEFSSEPMLAYHATTCGPVEKEVQP